MLIALIGLSLRAIAAAQPPPLRDERNRTSSAEIHPIEPPEDEFFTKELDYFGIPIKAPAEVDDKALFEARHRMDQELKHLPNARFNLKMVGAEMHIIGKDQNTSDLPEWRSARGKPFDGKLTIDERTRGMGGLMTSCGEENLLKLQKDRYFGRDICTHEFAHCIQDYGLSDDVREKIKGQFKRSTDAGLWKGSYAATNVSEFFAELTMWYFGTHGDMNMTGIKPGVGRDGLKAYDPEAYKLLDDLYSGRIKFQRVKKQ
jgi:alpha-glucosidase